MGETAVFPALHQPKNTMNQNTDNNEEPRGSKAKSMAPAMGEYKAPPVNPAWVAEVVKSYGITGKPREKVAAALSTAIEKQLAKVTRREKLDKLVLAAMAEAIRQAD